jgi:hypothetical protein
MPILSAIGSPSAAGATAPSICCPTSVSVAPSIAVAPDPPLEVGSFAPFSDFDVETLSHVTARRHTDAVDVVLTGASYEAHGCQDNRMASTRRIPPCPLIAGA